MLENITSPEDIKNFSQKEITQLAQEIRDTIVETVGKNGGHLASNLGIVELTIALHRVFSSPTDAIIFDVSHQCYAHKLLTGRYNQFSTLRQKDGISGFTNKAESEHDFFINGHSSTSISSALGLLTARKLSNKDGKVIAVIGDGALTGGMAFEGLCNAAQLSKDLIVILNDNQMSIDHNTGAISRYLSRLTMTRSYQTFRFRFDRGIDRISRRIPYLGKGLEKLIFRFKRSLKGLLLTNNLFTDLGFEYVGPLNGHDEGDLEKILKKVKKIHRPVVVHVVTKKGKGYEPAEKNPELYHGIGPFAKTSSKNDEPKKITFTEAFSQIMVEEAAKNEKICGITAAMAQGTGLSNFGALYKDRFFDVGIAEEHAVTFAGGLSEGGMLPVVCIYSTFVQRSVDQLIHDIALQKLPMILMLDRAGAVPNDGVTHQGVFDISLFRPIPELTIMSPVSKNDLHACFVWAENAKKAVVIRYPKSDCPEELEEFSCPVEEGKGIFVSGNKITNIEKSGKKILVVLTGGMYSEAKYAIEQLDSNISVDLYVLRFIKPFNEEYFIEMAKKYDGILFVEDGVKIGGIGQYLQGLLSKNSVGNTKLLAFDDKFYDHGNRAQILQSAGLSPDAIKDCIKELAND